MCYLNFPEGFAWNVNVLYILGAYHVFRFFALGSYAYGKLLVAFPLTFNFIRFFLFFLKNFREFVFFFMFNGNKYKDTSATFQKRLSNQNIQ